MSLFGSVGKTIGKAFKPSKGKYKLPQWQKEGTYAVAGEIPKILNQPFNAYTGDMTADINDTQRGVMGQLDDLIGRSANPDDLIARQQQYMNPLLNTRYRAIDEATAMSDQDLSARENMAGAFGDARHGMAWGDLQGERMHAYDDAAYQAWDQALRYGGQDISNEMTANNQVANYLNQQFGYGSAEQSTAQHQLDAMMKEFMREDLSDEQHAELAAKILALLPGGDYQQGSPGIGQQLLGTAATAAGAYFGAKA